MQQGMRATSMGTRTIDPGKDDFFRVVIEERNQENQYPVWIVEAWERLLADHFQYLRNPDNAFVTRELCFGRLPAMMRIRVTTPNVLKALRKRDPGAAKPYNFAMSPVLIDRAPELHAGHALRKTLRAVANS